jgi:hypothetical protein
LSTKNLHTQQSTPAATLTASSQRQTHSISALGHANARQAEGGCGTITIERKVHFGNGRRGRKDLRDGESPPAPTGRVPRVARLMALAIRFEQLIRDGVVADPADLARLGKVSRARMTQIMNLLQLAPSIQEDLLFLPCVTRGRAQLGISVMQSIASIADWSRQRSLWSAHVHNTGPGSWPGYLSCIRNCLPQQDS